MNNDLKSEMISRRRSFSVLESDDVSETKCIKRRRRSSPSSAAVRMEGGIHQQTVNLQVDQTTTTPTPTVKRSSRFRGVSRY